MSWYTSRRQYFNRITNDSGNKLRFITKTNIHGTKQQQQQQSSIVRPKSTNKAKPKAKVAPTDNNKQKKAIARKKGSETKTIINKQASLNKRKVNFAEKAESVNKKIKKSTSIGRKESNQEQKAKTSKVTQDNFI